MKKKKPGKAKVTTTKIAAPKKRPPPDTKHPEYIAGFSDSYNMLRMQKISPRLCTILTGAFWLTRKPVVPPDDARYGFYLYCEGWNDQNER